jgi:hypothetical protein
LLNENIIIVNTAKEIRSDIIEMLIKVEDIKALEVIRQELEVIFNTTKTNQKGAKVPAFLEGVKGIRENVTLDQLIEEQHYKPCTYEAFRSEADGIDWGEIPLEVMLEAIK